MFIVIEGTDGSGKATQTDLLVKRLQQTHAVETISFPQYGERSAAMVEEYLNGNFGSAEDVSPKAASIFYAADRFAAKKKINSWINEGKIVVSNRYVGSNMGHQGGKIKDLETRRQFFAWNHELEYEIFNIPRPTLNIILHMPAATAQALVDKKGERKYLNGKKRDIHEDDLQHLENAERAYLDMVRQFSDFTLIECVENGQLLSIEEIHERLWNHVQTLLQ